MTGIRSGIDHRNGTIAAKIVKWFADNLPELHLEEDEALDVVLVLGPRQSPAIVPALRALARLLHPHTLNISLGQSENGSALYGLATSFEQFIGNGVQVIRFEEPTPFTKPPKVVLAVVRATGAIGSIPVTESLSKSAERTFSHTREDGSVVKGWTLNELAMAERIILIPDGTPEANASIVSIGIERSVSSPAGKLLFGPDTCERSVLVVSERTRSKIMQRDYEENLTT